MKRSKSSRILKILSYVLLITGMIVILYPFYLTIITALKTPQESSQSFFSFPQSFYLGNFVNVLQKANYFVFFRNSAVVTLVSVFLIMVLIPMCSYAIARNMEKRYYKTMYFYLLAGIFVPFQVIMVPLVKYLAKLKLCNIPGLIIMCVTLASSQGVFLLVNYIRSVPRDGIDTEQMCVRKNRTTNFDIVISDEGSMGRSFVFYPGNAECMTEEELNIEYISNSSYFYMANLDSVTKKAAQMAKQKGSKIFMDADSYTDELLDAISWIDIFIGSEFVYEKMLEAGKSVKENCEYLYNKGPEIVIFTFGEKGCAGISKEGFFEIPAFDVDVKDTVGAGDVFHGAFLAAIVKGLSPKDAARFASGVAAIKCTRIGGRAGIPNWEVTDNFLETGEIDYREIDERVKKYGRGIEYV